MAGFGSLYPDFRRSENIEDRRKEKFNSFPQAPQMPNVFGDALGENVPPALDWRTDYAMPLQQDELSDQAGAGILQKQIDQYLAERNPAAAYHALLDQVP